MEEHCIKLRLPGQPVKRFRPYKAALLWAAEYYPQLKTETNSFLSISHGLAIPFPSFQNDTERLCWIQQSCRELTEQEYLEKVANNQNGAQAEKLAQTFFVDALRDDIEPKLLISGFKRELFCRLFRNNQCHTLQESQQELDLIIVANSTIIILEVKGKDDLSLVLMGGRVILSSFYKESHLLKKLSPILFMLVRTLINDEEAKKQIL